MMTRRNRIIRSFVREMIFWVGSSGVILYNVSLMFAEYAFLSVTFPPGEFGFNIAITVSYTLSVLAILGVVLQMTGRRHNWIAKGAFALTAVAGTITMVSWLAGSGNVSGAGTVGIAGLILGGVVAASLLHVLYGGGRSVVDAWMTYARNPVSRDDDDA